MCVRMYLCAGYQGSGSSITCGSNSAWSSASGCSLSYSDVGRLAFDTASSYTTSGCWNDPSTVCSSNGMRWDGTGVNFQQIGQYIRCSRAAGATMTSAVGVQTYYGYPTCAGTWTVWCSDGVQLGTLNTMSTSCSGGSAYRAGGACQITWSPRSCSYIELGVRVTNGGGGCCGGYPDAMIMSIVVRFLVALN